MGFSLDLSKLRQRAGLSTPDPDPLVTPAPVPLPTQPAPSASPASRLTTAPDVSHLATLAGVATADDTTPTAAVGPRSAANDHAATDAPHHPLHGARLARMAMLGMAEVKALALADRLDHRDTEGDDRRACAECSHLGNGGRCLAAATGRLPNTDRRHEPVLDLLQRCEAFGLRKGMQ